MKPNSGGAGIDHSREKMMAQMGSFLELLGEEGEEALGEEGEEALRLARKRRSEAAGAAGAAQGGGGAD